MIFLADDDIKMLINEFNNRKSYHRQSYNSTLRFDQKIIQSSSYPKNPNSDNDTGNALHDELNLLSIET